jgi:hypothetical protein
VLDECLADVLDRVPRAHGRQHGVLVEDEDLGHAADDTLSDPMPGNGKRRPSRPRIEVRPASASPEEAAAIAAAIEQFLRDTAPPPAAEGSVLSPWTRAGLFEGAGLDPAGPGPWADPEPWGSHSGG